jgi:hypothetical protein
MAPDLGTPKDVVQSAGGEDDALTTALKTTDKSETSADRVLRQFREGKLTHRYYTKLPSNLKRIYKAMHGYRPASPDETKGRTNALAKRTNTRRAEKQARKRARR